MTRKLSLILGLMLTQCPAPAIADDLDEVLDDLERYQTQVRAEAQLGGESYSGERMEARRVQKAHSSSDARSPSNRENQLPKMVAEKEKAHR